MDATRRHGEAVQGERPHHDQGRHRITAASESAASEPAVSESAASRQLNFAARKEQQLVFLLTRQLVDAQIVRADQRRSQSLWQEVAALELDPDRITALMYCVSDHDDVREMEAMDHRYDLTRKPHASPWLSWGRRALPTRWRGAGRRGAPPAAPRAHRQAR